MNKQDLIISSNYNPPEEYIARFTKGKTVDVMRDDGAFTRSTVKYSPWRLGSGVWLVGVKGIAGGYALQRVKIVTEVK